MTPIETAAHAARLHVYRARQRPRALIVERGCLLALSSSRRLEPFAEVYYGGQSADPATLLQRSVTQIEQPFIAAVLHEQYLFVANSGNFHLYLIRNEEAQRLTSEPPQIKGQTFNVYLPIALQVNDIILLCNGSACQLLSQHLHIRSLRQATYEMVIHGMQKSRENQSGAILARLRKYPPITPPKQLLLSLLIILALAQIIALFILR